MPETQNNKHITLSSAFVFLQETGKYKPSQMSEKALQSFTKHLGDNEPNLDDLTEESVRSWVNDIKKNLSESTVKRYVESLSKVYTLAVKSGICSKKTPFVGVKSYLRTSTDEGVDRTSVEQYKDIKRLAAVRNVGLTGVSMAIDVVMYSFYNAAMPLDEVIELRIDSKNLSNLPQSVAIQGKYEAPIRRYLFPLKQWQQTTKVIRKSVEANFRTALKIYKIEIGDKSISEYIEYAWASAAKANGIKIADICACVPSLAEKFDIVPSNLSSRQISTIKRKVANSIVDMAPHWYAIRFIGDDRLVRDELQEAAEGSSVKIYYPLDEICKQVGKKRVFTTKPTIKSIMFVQTSAITIQIISQKRTAESKFIIVRDNATKDKRLAVIPNEQMHKFSMLISNGFDILGDEDMKAVKFEVGDYVNITEGMLKGYNGRVLKITTEGKNDTTVLQIEADSFGSDMKEVLGKHLYISIPESLASKL